MYLLLKALKEYRERNSDVVFSPTPPQEPERNLLRDAIADAKAARAIAMAVGKGEERRRRLDLNL